MSERVLTNWAICADRPDPYKPPEWDLRYLSGTCDGKNITTSHVVDIVGPRLYRTRSGSLYKLEGDPNPAYVEYCRRLGITLDRNAPLKRKGF